MRGSWKSGVSPRQHPSSLIGKSWTKEHGEPELDEHDLPKPTFVPWLAKTVEHPEAYGIYFQDRWEEALSVQPRFLYINDWNEWTAGKYHEQSTLDSINFMRRGKDATYFFVDQYNSEFNRCIVMTLMRLMYYLRLFLPAYRMIGIEIIRFLTMKAIMPAFSIATCSFRLRCSIRRRHACWAH